LTFIRSSKEVTYSAHIAWTVSLEKPEMKCITQGHIDDRLTLVESEVSAKSI